MATVAQLKIQRPFEVSRCTCRTPPEWLPGRPPSRALFVAAHGRCLLLAHVGPDVDYDIENVGAECLFEGHDDGIWIWTGRIRAWCDYFGEHDYELDGESVAVTREQWAAWVDHEEVPWDETSADYYAPGPPCPEHGSVRLEEVDRGS